ncbi:MAG: hypothetical protein Pg6C_19730 [Treponemataceae bacterium]|nr:MAG: hypothetical protein Pg6C_19730 [Treponemataceae bacterium]
MSKSSDCLPNSRDGILSTARGETASVNHGGLRESFFTNLKKDVIEFGFGDSEKNCYRAVQIENADIT